MHFFPQQSSFFFRFLLGMLGLSFFICFASPAQAAELLWQTKTQKAKLGQSFVIDFLIDAQNEKINALEGRVRIPQKFLEFQEFRDGNSIVNFWIERPKAKVKTSSFRFAGIIPGGYSGKKGRIFSVMVKTKRVGKGKLSLEEARVFLHDGKGAKTDVKSSPLELIIAKRGIEPEAETSPLKDQDPPELFGPIIAQHPDVFQGSPFVSFSTQDKGVGIDHYEIKEGEGSFELAESPYLLKNPQRAYPLAVRVFDMNQNFTEITIPGPLLRLTFGRFLIGLLFLAGLFYLLRLALIKFQSRMPRHHR